MRTKIYSGILVFTAFLFAVGCSSSRKGSGYMKADVEAKNTEIQINMGYPVNTANDDELRKSVYTDENSKYFFRQNKENQFKDNAPFVEILDGGKRERLWFTSSRADSLYRNAPPTNFYQQVYYCEREVGAGADPRKGWGEPVRFSLRYDKPQLRDYIEGFNLATKGTVAVCNGTMIVSCDQWNETEDWNSIRYHLRNLWEVDMKSYPLSYPVQIDELSNPGTWESQPTLSANGKHLFFVSDRMVNSSDWSYSSNERGNDINIFYSFKGSDGKWSKPVVVKELYSEKNEVSPQISIKGDKLYFSCDKSTDYEIYETELTLDDVKGGYSLNVNSLKPFDTPLFDRSADKVEEFHVNGSFNQKYPFYYYNPSNKTVPQAFFWASDNPKGLGSYDIYACAMPFNVTLNVVVADLCPQGGNEHVANPVINLSGAKELQEASESAQFALYSGLTYELSGGSTASPENGTYSCDVDQSYIFVGYSRPDKKNPCSKNLHLQRISGAEVLSEITQKNGKIQIQGIVRDTTVFDTIYVTKAWEKKPPCPGKLNIEPTYRQIAYFQTGYWEVNTTANLKRDLALLHEGFEVTPGKDIYNPSGKIIRDRSDYKTVGYDAPMFPVKTDDHYTYSIANAPWIELHPNNQYWGDRPGYESKLEQRMEGRKKRIEDYVDFAKKVDTNLKNLTDTIKNNYIQLLDLHKDKKPQLLIEIIAVSDPREVSRSWYIGDTVKYRGTKYDEIKKAFETIQVKIVPPSVDEKTKTVYNIKPCTVELNSEGDNGSILGILTTSNTDQNTNLSRLRAWYGYKEVLKHLTDSETFNHYMQEGKVALPDNDVPYDKADIIIITYGKRTDDNIDNPQHPYPSANNPTGNGYYDYDNIRRIEIQTRLLLTEEAKAQNDYCCDPVETR